MRCEEIRELMSEHLDGVLDREKEAFLKDHLANCESCREELVGLMATVSLLHNLEPVEPPPDLLDGIHARLDVADTAPRKAPTRAGPALPWLVFNSPQFRVALAAGLVIMVGTYVFREGRKAKVDGPMPVRRQPAATVHRPSAIGRQPLPDDDLMQIATNQPPAVVRKLLATTRQPSATKDRLRSAEVDGGIWRGPEHGEAEKTAVESMVDAPVRAEPVAKPALEAVGLSLSTSLAEDADEAPAREDSLRVMRKRHVARKEERKTAKTVPAGQLIEIVITAADPASVVRIIEKSAVSFQRVDSARDNEARAGAEEVAAEPEQIPDAHVVVHARVATNSYSEFFKKLQAAGRISSLNLSDGKSDRISVPASAPVDAAASISLASSLVPATTAPGFITIHVTIGPRRDP